MSIFISYNLTIVLLGTLILHSQTCDSGFLIYQPITFQQVIVILISVLCCITYRRLLLFSAYLIWILLQSSSSSWMLHIFKWGICEIWDFRIGEVDSQCDGGGTPCYIIVGCFIDGCYLWSKILWMQFAGTSWHELNYIRQAVGFLVKTHLLW